MLSSFRLYYIQFKDIKILWGPRAGYEDQGPEPDNPKTRIIKAVTRRCSTKTDVRKNFAKFTGKLLCQGLFFNKVAGLMLATLFKKEALTQLFSCEFCEIFKSIYFHRTPPGGCFWNNQNFKYFLNTANPNPTKWSNTLK